MELKDCDYENLRSLSNSEGWKILCKELDERIEALQQVLDTPNLKTILNITDAVNELNFINHKREEKIYLMKLKSLPEQLMATKIMKS